MANTSIKLSGTYDSIEAYRILEEMREIGADFEDIKTEAETAASTATAAVTTAQTAANNASTYADNAQTYAGNANTSAGAAAGYAANASTSATNAATSETNASNSASAAATSESNAATSETNASDSATAAAASAAEVEAALDDYLPLSGGALTGSLGFNGTGGAYITRNINTNRLEIMGGTAWNTSASLVLSGKDRDGGANGGIFELFASIDNNPKKLVGKPDGTLTWDGQPLLPVGIVQAFAGNTIPNGWLLCDGSAVSRTDYADLYSVIGDTYGAGDGSTTFNLPNLVDKFVEGSATAGTEKSAGLPNITGTLRPSNNDPGCDMNVDGTGAITGYNVQRKTYNGSSSPDWNAGCGFDFDASLSNSIYGNSNTVQPPALTMRYIIKY